MPQLHFYVSDEVETQIRVKAKQANLPLSKYLAEMVKRETGAQNQWPIGYFELFDQWQGEPQAKPAELAIEKSKTLIDTPQRMGKQVAHPTNSYFK